MFNDASNASSAWHSLQNYGIVPAAHAHMTSGNSQDFIDASDQHYRDSQICPPQHAPGDTLNAPGGLHSVESHGIATAAPAHMTVGNFQGFSDVSGHMLAQRDGMLDERYDIDLAYDNAVTTGDKLSLVSLTTVPLRVAHNAPEQLLNMRAVLEHCPVERPQVDGVHSAQVVATASELSPLLQHLAYVPILQQPQPLPSTSAQQSTEVAALTSADSDHWQLYALAQHIPEDVEGSARLEYDFEELLHESEWYDRPPNVAPHDSLMMDQPWHDAQSADGTFGVSAHSDSFYHDLAGTPDGREWHDNAMTTGEGLPLPSPVVPWPVAQDALEHHSEVRRAADGWSTTSWQSSQSVRGSSAQHPAFHSVTDVSGHVQLQPRPSVFDLAPCWQAHLLPCSSHVVLAAPGGRGPRMSEGYDLRHDHVDASRTSVDILSNRYCGSDLVPGTWNSEVHTPPSRQSHGDDVVHVAVGGIGRSRAEPTLEEVTEETVPASRRLLLEPALEGLMVPRTLPGLAPPGTPPGTPPRRAGGHLRSSTPARRSRRGTLSSPPLASCPLRPPALPPHAHPPPDHLLPDRPALPHLHEQLQPARRHLRGSDREHILHVRPIPRDSDGRRARPPRRGGGVDWPSSGESFAL